MFDREVLDDEIREALMALRGAYDRVATKLGCRGGYAVSTDDDSATAPAITILSGASAFSTCGRFAR